MTLKEIKSIVCKSFGIEESDFVIFGRQITHSYARYAYYVLAAKYGKFSHRQIAITVCLTHSNVTRGIKRHPEIMAKRRDYAFSFMSAENSVKQLIDSK
jgi:hypothetical protein